MTALALAREDKGAGRGADEHDPEEDAVEVDGEEELDEERRWVLGSGFAEGQKAGRSSEHCVLEVAAGRRSRRHGGDSVNASRFPFDVQARATGAADGA